ncbi:hypothetical protein K0M31_014294 [Melipona bicolor]|uniref:Uncharacterized protein n=1 Tax=Melipona bicolor TaxID=60889 RepID=A0AA40G8H0_9HYME|nr:hypothetical protein K0M31_014294 [Melipona bicolor]
MTKNRRLREILDSCDAGRGNETPRRAAPELKPGEKSEEGGEDRKGWETKKDERRVAKGQEEKERGAGREEGVDHVEVATRSPQAPVKGPTAIRIRGALSDRDSQPHERPSETETNEPASPLPEAPVAVSCTDRFFVAVEPLPVAESPNNHGYSSDRTIIG